MVFTSDKLRCMLMVGATLLCAVLLVVFLLMFNLQAAVRLCSFSQLVHSTDVIVPRGDASMLIG